MAAPCRADFGMRISDLYIPAGLSNPKSAILRSIPQESNPKFIRPDLCRCSDRGSTLCNNIVAFAGGYYHF
jgi:hypothetical protein